MRSPELQKLLDETFSEEEKADSITLPAEHFFKIGWSVLAIFAIIISLVIFSFEREPVKEHQKLISTSLDMSPPEPYRPLRYSEERSPE